MTSWVSCLLAIAFTKLKRVQIYQYTFQSIKHAARSISVVLCMESTLFSPCIMYASTHRSSNFESFKIIRLSTLKCLWSSQDITKLFWPCFPRHCIRAVDIKNRNSVLYTKYRCFTALENTNWQWTVISQFLFPKLGKADSGFTCLTGDRLFLLAQTQRLLLSLPRALCKL